MFGVTGAANTVEASASGSTRVGIEFLILFSFPIRRMDLPIDRRDHSASAPSSLIVGAILERNAEECKRNSLCFTRSIEKS